MQEVRRVVETQRADIDQDGDLTRENIWSTSTEAGIQTTAANIVWYIYGLIAMALAARFVLKIAGANPGNSFVDFVYSISGILSSPFDSAFGVSRVTSGDVSSVFEPSILVAIVVYGLIAWGITRLLTISDHKTS